ncbi:MAG: iron export ABC transporter permease subunit FetB [Oscillospiraceae bacterium]
MKDIIELQLCQFSLVYLLLIIVLVIMKKCKIEQTKLLIIANIRMAVQLAIAGLILTYIFDNPHPAFTILYLISMTSFAIHRVLSKNKDLNKKFQLSIAVSLAISGLSIVFYFVKIVVGESVFNPQYVIPLSGMIIGNAMTGVSLGVKTFKESFRGQRSKIETLINMGVSPDKILLPFVNQSLETALLPTMNSMLGMGIVALPGMMTGQILSGTKPTTAILYQIAIMTAICTVVCLSVFCSLYFGYKKLYNSDNQIDFFE